MKALGVRAINGWKVWKFKNKNGEWIYIDELRKGGKSDRSRGAQKSAGRNASDINTIVCPAKESSFEDVFMGENCWYGIRINEKRIPKIKYLAIYRKHPVSAITHIARVKSIKPHKNTGKYIVHFAGSPRRLKKVPLNKSRSAKRKALQSTLFTSLKRLRTAKNLDEV